MVDTKSRQITWKAPCLYGVWTLWGWVDNTLYKTVTGTFY